MRKWLMRRGIEGMEERLGVPLPHLWEIERVAPGMLVALGLTLPAVGYRKTAPRELIHLVRLGATLAQDCGDCLQIAVNAALSEGVPRPVVEAALRGWEGRLEALQAAALRFGERSATGGSTDDEREALAAAVGESAMVELALAAATSQLFPVLRRAMGLSRACRLDLIRYPTS